MAAKLAASDSTQIAALNKMAGKLEATAGAAGKTVFAAVYDAGVNAAKGLVAGLTGQQKQIEAAMLNIAKAMASSIRKALGIHSKSTVMEMVGGFAMEGLRAGILGGLGDLDRTMRRVAAVTAAGLPGPALSAAGPAPSIRAPPTGLSGPVGAGAGRGGRSATCTSRCRPVTRRPRRRPS